MVLVYSQSTTIITTINFGMFLSLQKKPHIPLAVTFPTPTLQPWATTNLLSIDLPLLGISFPSMESHKVILHDQLLSPTAMFSRFIHVTACIVLHYFIWPSVSHCVYTLHFMYQLISQWAISTFCFSFCTIVPSVIRNNSLPRRIHHHEPRSSNYSREKASGRVTQRLSSRIHGNQS